MAELRYEQVGRVHRNEYMTGSPVIIAVSAQLNDRESGTRLVQIKFHNIGEKDIESLRVRIQPLDDQDEPLGEAIENTYEELHAAHGDMFGQQYVTVLPDYTTSDFSLHVLSVTFADGETWTAPEGDWTPLAEPEPLSRAVPLDLIGLFREQYGDLACVQYTQTADLWYCLCGTLMHEGVDTCEQCGLTHEQVETLDVAAWVAAEHQRMEDERLAAEAAEAARIAALERKKRIKKAILWSSVAAACVAVLVCAGIYWQSIAYSIGNMLLKMDSYQASEAVFTMLAERDFKDADERVWDVRTDYAQSRLKLYDYKGAVECFSGNQRYRLMKDTTMASLFLTGEWYDENGKYYFVMEEDGAVRYNIPVVTEATGTYVIADSYFVREKENGEPEILWQFLVEDEDTIVVVSQSGDEMVMVRYG